MLHYTQGSAATELTMETVVSCAKVCKIENNQIYKCTIIIIQQSLRSYIKPGDYFLMNHYYT